MTENEKIYKSTINRLAASLLIFIVLSQVLGLLSQYLSSLYALWLEPEMADIASTLTGGIVYILDFMLPVAFFRLFSGGRPIEPMKLSPKLPRTTFVYIGAGVAIILAAAYVNYYMISFTPYSEFSSEMLWAQSYDTVTQIVLAFVTTAIIPGFVEEFLFRGLVLTNLRPFGRGTAIVGSAVLFGLMHQNVEQIFYATVAGLVLGYIYDKTGSIWCGVLLHMINNGISVLESVVIYRWEEASADRFCSLIEGVIFFIGVICLVVWAVKNKKSRPVFADGIFGEIPEPSGEDVCLEVGARQKVKLFFSPLMITYVALCFINMVAFIVMALVLYG